MKKIIIMVSALVLVAAATLTLVLVLGPKKGPKSVTVNYHSEEAVVTLYEEEVTNSEDFVLQTANDTNQYRFIGWFFDEAYTEEFNLAKFKELFEKEKEINLYAKWVKIVRYQVTFIVEGEIFIVKDVIENDKVDPYYDDPVKEGYDFAGWLLDGEPFDLNTAITKDISLHAAFKDVEYVTVTLDLDGGYGIQLEFEAIKGRPFSLGSDPIKDGYNFIGFTLNGNPFDFNSNIEGDITLVAQWEIKMLTITLIIEGESSSVVVPYGTSVFDLVEPTKEGYLFNLWLDKNMNPFYGTFTNDTTLTASFIEDNVYYMVTFITNGGTPVDDMYILAGRVISEPVITTKENHTFVGWFLGNGQEFVIGMSTVTKDLVLYAHWDENPKITITFDFNDPMYANQEQVIYVGETLVGLLPEVDDGYKHIEYWMYGDTVYIDEPLFDDLTLIASWKYNSTQQYTVTLMLTPIVYLTFYEGEPFYYDTPEVEGQIFAYWKLGSNIFHEGTPVTADITLKAFWYASFYTVKYVYNGVEVFEGVFAFDTSYAFLRPLNYEGEILEKFYMDEDLTIPIDPNETLRFHTTFYVRPLKILTINFYGGDDIIKSINDHVEGESLLHDDIPTYRDGDYVSDHWYDSDGNILDENTIITEDKDYYPYLVYDPIQTQYLAYIYIFEDDTFLYMEEVMIDIGTIVTTSLIQDLYDGFDEPVLDDYVIFEVLLNNETPPPFEIFEFAAIRVNVVPK